MRATHTQYFFIPTSPILLFCLLFTRGILLKLFGYPSHMRLLSAALSSTWARFEIILPHSVLSKTRKLLFTWHLFPLLWKCCILLLSLITLTISYNIISFLVYYFLPYRKNNLHRQPPASKIGYSSSQHVHYPSSQFGIQRKFTSLLRGSCFICLLQDSHSLFFSFPNFVFVKLRVVIKKTH